MDFLTLNPENFSLDISDLSFKIAKLKKKRNSFVLSSFCEKEIKPGIIKEGEIKDEKKLVDLIKEAVRGVKGERLKTKYVAVSLPEEKSFLQVIQMPKLPEGDLKSAIVYEAENYIPLPIEDVYLDFQIIPSLRGNLDHLDVLLAAFPKKVIDPYLSCLKSAGLEPIVFEIESLAIARTLIKQNGTSLTYLLIDLGATKTRFIIFSDQSVRFTSSIQVSSQDFTEAISRNMGITFLEAEKLKNKYGLEEKIKLKTKENILGKGEEKGKIFEALIPVLVDLIQQIKKHLDYYQTHAVHEHGSRTGKIIPEILLCGGGANLKGLPELLSLELKIPVKIGNPWINISAGGKKETSKLSLEESLEYTTALGLALRGIKK